MQGYQSIAVFATSLKEALLTSAHRERLAGRRGISVAQIWKNSRPRPAQAACKGRSTAVTPRSLGFGPIKRAALLCDFGEPFAATVDYPAAAAVACTVAK
jgi:hypothetical protein